ncbi:MAG: 1-deoxy-D-xylulose-5-phosphate reductoisomerase [Nitrospira bacterium HGW-Nitrospira-1]|nr:MAG: 1-deoxy-D-xylulose-5-phosphate reductoisomerase [Nitrospira bacterium HGW-Nitrospira-1]
MKNIAILGSTGSIGRNTLEVIAQNRGRFRVVAMSAGSNIDLFEQQIKTFSPNLAVMADTAAAYALSKRFSKRVGGIEILSGAEGVNRVAGHADADFVISAIAGSAGLLPTITAIRAGKTVGIANKEALVMAGDIIMKEAKKNKVNIIPVDSEHSAVSQCIEGRNSAEIRRIILTASGGPFINKTKNALKNIKAKDALRHPNWSMGRKITIDSATLMNKGLEVIEACRLFDLPPEKVDVLIHPQSIIHSLVEFKDRSCLAQLSMPDMRGPIAYALSYPERLAEPIPGLELEKIGSLTFRKPDHDMFPCLSYAYEAMKTGGTAPAVLNAANEIAVYAFLENKIGFNDIPAVIRKTVESHTALLAPDLNDVLEADRWAREKAEHYVKELGI